MPRSFRKTVSWSVELGFSDGAHCTSCPQGGTDRLVIQRTPDGVYTAETFWGCNGGDSLFDVHLGDLMRFVDYIITHYPLDLGTRADVISMKTDIVKESQLG